MSENNTKAIAFLVIGLVIGLDIGLIIPLGGVPEDTSLTTVQTRGTIIVGTSADYPPFESLNSTNHVVGFDADLTEYLYHSFSTTVLIISSAWYIFLKEATLKGVFEAAICILKMSSETFSFTITVS